MGVTLIIVGNGLFLTAMLYSTRYPLIFGILFVTFNFILSFSDLYARKKIGVAIKGSFERLEEEIIKKNKKEYSIYKNALLILKDYYIRRPHFIQKITVLIIGSIGIIFTLLWIKNKQPVFGIIAFNLYSLAIVLSELILAIWRKKRDRQIDELAAALVELKRK